MRKIILVAAMVLVSASAHAGDRSLSLAATSQPIAAPQTATTVADTSTAQPSEAAPAVEAPKYVERPPAIPAPAAAPAAAPAPAPAAAAAPQPAPKTTAKVETPKRKRVWTERRIIGELHRHGIYW